MSPATAKARRSDQVEKPAGLPQASPAFRSVLVAICAPVLGPDGNQPTSHPAIDGWKEWRRVREVVEEVAGSHFTPACLPLRLVRLHPPTLSKLRESLHYVSNGPAYSMVHIISYALDDGCLRMEKGNGREELLCPEELASAFRGSGVELVLLNVCRGRRLASALIRTGEVGSVITPRTFLSDPEATLLAREIYLRLSLGDTLDQALAWARESIISAYRGGRFERLKDQPRLALAQYARYRAENIVLHGDRKLRWLLPLAIPERAEPVFDLSEPPANLPHRDDMFVGRGKELVQIGDWMGEAQFRGIALTGIGGIGKSSLAATAALRNSWRFRGLIYVSAKDPLKANHSFVDEVCRQLEAVLGLEGSLSNLPTSESRQQRAVEILNERRCFACS